MIRIKQRTKTVPGCSATSMRNPTIILLQLNFYNFVQKIKSKRPFNPVTQGET